MAWFAGREVLVCVGDALMEFLLEFVLCCVRIGIAAKPKVLDEFFALFIGCEFFPGVAFGLSENRIDVADPIDIRFLQLTFDFARLFFGTAFGFAELERKRLKAKRGIEWSGSIAVCGRLLGEWRFTPLWSCEDQSGTTDGETVS